VKDGETVAFNIFEKAISKNSSLLNELLDLQQQKEEPQKFIGLLTQQASSLATSYQITNSINPQQVKIHPYVHKKNQELIKRQKLNKIKINKIIDIIIQLNIDSKTLSLNYNDLWLLIEHSCRNISTF
jgi:DNA polymerase III delta subunit